MNAKPPRPVDLYFDFVSPYAYLALSQCEAFGEQHGVDWRLHPVVYGALLGATGLVGPAEIDIKRRYTFRDVARTARMLGVPLIGPPAHPFRSLEALRAACLYVDDPRGLSLAVRLARSCWGEGRDLTDLEVIGAAIAEAGLDPQRLAERIAEPAIKQRLRQETEQALAAGVFGVPTFAWDGELFWGQDRMLQLGARLDGRLDRDETAAGAMEGRPRGADRSGSPMRR